MKRSIWILILIIIGVLLAAIGITRSDSKKKGGRR